jgi:hypothetical protein
MIEDQQDKRHAPLRDPAEAPPRSPAEAEGFALTSIPIESSEQSAGREQWPQSVLLAEAAVRETFADSVEHKQFTLRDLFVLVTACALLSLPLGRFPRPMFAGLVGGLTVLWMFMQTFFEPRHALVRYGWWALLCMYLTACAMAVAGV